VLHVDRRHATERTTEPVDHEDRVWLRDTRFVSDADETGGKGGIS